MCFFLNKKVHLLVSELYIYQNARCNNNKKLHHLVIYFLSINNKHIVVQNFSGKPCSCHYTELRRMLNFLQLPATRFDNY